MIPRSFLAVLAASSLLLPGLASAQNARIAQFRGDRPAALTYTFDDGLRDQFTLAVPMLNEVGIKGTFFIVAGRTVETPAEAEEKQFQPKIMGTISWPELKLMAEQGHEIASHTMSHRNLPKIPPADAETELSKAYDVLKERMGTAPLTVALPYNAKSPEVEALALKYYIAFRAFQKGVGGKDSAESLNAWAEKLVRERKWGVLMFHAIKNGYAQMDDPEQLRLHLQFVKAHENEIWVDTFANVTRYEKERADAKLSASGAPGRLKLELLGSLDPQIYNVPLTLVIDAPGAQSASARRAGQPLPAEVREGAIYLEAVPGPEPIELTWTP